jgi:alpha-D-ribose 1-methylphosphonate 5-triphosphate synthase subunit PhnG
MTDNTDSCAVVPDLSREAWLGLLSRAQPDALREALASLGPEPAAEAVKGPEIGLIMARGRLDGEGAPFNLGEMTATRCLLRLAPDGPMGAACVLGRDRAHARRAALVDALMQTDRAEAVRAAVLSPLRRAEALRRQDRARKAAATKVDFFTLVRGED